jgi:hypothetical protein
MKITKITSFCLFTLAASCGRNEQNRNSKLFGSSSTDDSSIDTSVNVASTGGNQDYYLQPGYWYAPEVKPQKCGPAEVPDDCWGVSEDDDINGSRCKTARKDAWKKSTTGRTAQKSAGLHRFRAVGFSIV